MTFKLAAAQYPIDWLESWEAYHAKLRRWVAQAADQGVRFAVFPEYGAMELASLDPPSAGDLAGSLASVASLEARVNEVHAALAREHRIHILAASMPVRRDGKYRNAARLFTPSGAMGEQQKLVMTRFEDEQWGVSAGRPLRLFDTALGKVGVLVCYDAEFPLLARALVEAGAELILVPSCTDTRAGYHRVRIAAQARALEGQCYTVQAPTVGEAPWSPAVDENRGAGAIFGPPDLGFPETGVVAEGERDVPQWVIGEIDLARVGEARASGAVYNYRDWTRQPGGERLPPVEAVELR